jgi:predicted phosphoribosyltransferase
MYLSRISLEFVAVSIHYRDFAQVSDEEVVDQLKKSAAEAV